MSHKFIIRIIVFVFGLAAAQSGWACTCGGGATVLDTFEKSVNVFTAKIVSLDPVDAKPSGNVNGANAVVEKVYKGDVKPGDKVFFIQGGGSDCVLTFNHLVGKDIEQKLPTVLVYEFNGQLLNIRLSICDRLGSANPSSSYIGDREDYAYLEKIDQVRGKTRVSGFYGLYTYKDDIPLMPKNPKIRIISETGQEYVAVADNHLFEIYDIPPGNYTIRPETPIGFTVSPESFKYTDYGKYLYSYGFPWDSFPAKIEPGRHARIDFDFIPYNPLPVRVLDPNGQPIVGATLDPAITDATADSRNWTYKATTDENGFAKVGVSKPGKYRLLINPEGKITATDPFARYYYPGVTDFANAILIDVPLGGFKEPIIFRVPDVRSTNIIEGTVKYADGSPVDNETIEFVPSIESSEYDYYSSDYTRNGRFRLKVLSGAEGYLRAKYKIRDYEFKKCPETYQKLQSEFGNGKGYFDVTIKSTPLRIINNSKDFLLQFPFTPCQKE